MIAIWFFLSYFSNFWGKNFILILFLIFQICLSLFQTFANRDYTSFVSAIIWQTSTTPDVSRKIGVLRSDFDIPSFYSRPKKSYYYFIKITQQHLNASPVNSTVRYVHFETRNDTSSKNTSVISDPNTNPTVLPLLVSWPSTRRHQG